jgi:hypothetical protein
MVEEKRTYEADTHIVQTLKVQFRSMPVENPDPQVRSYSRVGNAYRSQAGFTFSREVILRLIDWLKDA